MTTDQKLMSPEAVATALSRTLPPLETGSWLTMCDESATAAGTLASLPDGEWVGLTETTAGAKAVRRATREALTGTDGATIDLDVVYELRLWRPVGSEGENGLMAHEIRWLNGAGSAEIQVNTGSGAGKPCYYRQNSYVQHHSAGRERPAPKMTSLEVFIEESQFGNTVLADEFFTGTWG